MLALRVLEIDGSRASQVGRCNFCALVDPVQEVHLPIGEAGKIQMACRSKIGDGKLRVLMAIPAVAQYQRTR